MLFMHATVTDLDKAFLNHTGGKGHKSFVQILDDDNDDNDDSNQTPIIYHSSYYDFEKLTSNLNNFKNKFGIFSSNIQSINAKINELRIFVKCLQKYSFTFSVICIQESRLSEVDDTYQIQLEPYQCITLGKSCNAKGRGEVIIYLLDKFEHIPMLKLNKYNTWEGQGIQVKKGLAPAKPANIGHQKMTYNIIKIH